MGLVVAAQSAPAFDVADLFVSPANPVDEKNYDPIPVNYTYAVALTSQFNPATCRTQAYCDTIDVVIDVPAGFSSLYAVIVHAEWENMVCFLDDPEQDDYDMRLWEGEEDDTAFDASTNCGGPERVGISEPGSRTMFVTLNNYAATDAPYTMRAEFLDEGELPPLPRFQRRRRDGGGESVEQTAKGRRGSAFGAPDSPSVSEAPVEPRSVDQPGPDGELTEMELAGLEGSPIEQGGGGLNPFLLAAIAVVLSGGGVGGFLFYKRRQERQAEDAV